MAIQMRTILASLTPRRALAPLLCVGASLFCGAPLQAQIPVTGVVEPLAGGGACGLAETHQLACAELALKDGPGSNLSSWEGQVVTILGRDIGTPNCPVWEVSSIQPAAVQLDWFGNPVPGGPVYFEVVVSPAVGPRSFTVYGSRHAAFSPYGPQLGTVLLGMPYFSVCSGTATPFSVCATLLPNNAALSGTQVYAQVAATHAYTELSNVVCIDIL